MKFGIFLQISFLELLGVTGLTVTPCFTFLIGQFQKILTMPLSQGRSLEISSGKASGSKAIALASSYGDADCDVKQSVSTFCV